jgi:penicillin-binding protein 2
MTDRYTFKDHNLERQVFLSRMFIGGGVAVVLLVALIARLVFLQVYQHEYYSTKSDAYRISVQPVVPNRGLIYDRNGVILAENRPSYTLTLVKENAGDIDASLDLIRSLVALTPDDEEEFRERLEHRAIPFSSVPLRFNLTEQERANIAVNQFQLPGISVDAELVRFYPQGELMAHALGYVAALSEEDLKLVDPENYAGTHQLGKMGIEKFYEDLLHGKVGYETVEKNARGQIMKVLDRTDPVPGQDIVLHLDSNLQRTAVEVLGHFRGGIVALDPETGGVLALVSKPSFDPNLFVGGISKADYAKLQDRTQTPLFNRALARYSPGSTIKPFLALAALDTGIRTREYAVNDNGLFRLNSGGRVQHDWPWWDFHSGHGLVDLERAIYQSCDVYFWDLARDMNIDTMHDFLYQFGFGRNTSVDLPQASIGILPSEAWKRESRGEPWYPGDTVNSAIGQGYTEATPLQLATAAMLMANKGKWNPPALLKRIGHDAPDFQHEHQMPDIVLKNPDDWNFVQQAMQSVVHKDKRDGFLTNGTAYEAVGKFGGTLLTAYHMAGKSGTAQVVNQAADFNGNSADIPEEFQDNALFIAFAPVENPKIAVAVYVEHGAGGSGIAGPMARQILDAYLLGPDGQLKPEFQVPESPPLISLNP